SHRNTGGNVQSSEKILVRIEAAVSIGILQNRDLVSTANMIGRRQRGFVKNCAQVLVVLHDLESSRKRVLDVLHHPEAASFIEMEIQRLTNRRFARDDLHLQTVTDVEEAQRFFGRGSLTTARTFDSFPARLESFD